MKFSAVVTLQYDTIFSAFSVHDWKKGLDWMQQSGLDGAELCISHYNDIDVYAVKEELDKRGLGCSTLSTGQARGLEGLCLSGVSNDVVERTQKRFYEHIDAAAILGSKVTLGLMRGLGSTHNADADLDSIFKLLYRAGFEEYASFECFNRPSVQTVLEETAPWVNHIRSLN